MDKGKKPLCHVFVDKNTIIFGPAFRLANMPIQEKCKEDRYMIRYYQCISSRNIQTTENGR
jgi:hypothetical protein